MTDLADSPAESLEHKLRCFFGRAEVGALRVENFAPFADGHAGHTFGVDLLDRAGQLSRYVLKRGPVGVRRSGSTDIFRQVVLLDALYKAGLPVPQVRWSSPDDQALGAPFIVMTRLAGRSYIIWEPDPVFAATGNLPQLWLRGVRALAQVHAVDHRTLLQGWEAPTSLSLELDRWSALTRHTEDVGLRAALNRLATALRSSMPDDAPVGLLHGDFQPGNILYSDGNIAGIIDWDLAAIGPQSMDLGWYLMMSDATCWHAEWRPVGAPPHADIIEAYLCAGGRVRNDLCWHQAFAHFRLGAITGLNLKLHLSRRRVDAVWERFAISMPELLRKAFDLLAMGQAHD